MVTKVNFILCVFYHIFKKKHQIIFFPWLRVWIFFLSSGKPLGGTDIIIICVFCLFVCCFVQSLWLLCGEGCWGSRNRCGQAKEAGGSSRRERVAWTRLVTMAVVRSGWIQGGGRKRVYGRSRQTGWEGRRKCHLWPSALWAHM